MQKPCHENVTYCFYIHRMHLSGTVPVDYNMQRQCIYTHIHTRAYTHIHISAFIYTHRYSRTYTPVHVHIPHTEWRVMHYRGVGMPLGWMICISAHSCSKGVPFTDWRSCPAHPRCHAGVGGSCPWWMSALTKSSTHLPSLQSLGDIPGPLHQFVDYFSVPVSASTSPADNCVEKSGCYNRVLEGLQQGPAHSKGPQSPQQVEVTLALLVQDVSVCGPAVQFVV